MSDTSTPARPERINPVAENRTAYKEIGRYVSNLVEEGLGKVKNYEKFRQDTAPMLEISESTFNNYVLSLRRGAIYGTSSYLSIRIDGQEHLGKLSIFLSTLPVKQRELEKARRKLKEFDPRFPA